MEYFDVINEQDEVIGQASRQACHANPKLLHRTIHFTLIDIQHQKALVTVRNPELKFDGGKVCFMGEHVKAGETYTAAVVRGVQEELNILPTEWQEVDRNIFSYATQRELVRFFLVNWNGEPLHPDPNEIAEISWVTIDELAQPNNNYSAMTQHWVTQVNWQKVFKDA